MKFKIGDLVSINNSQLENIIALLREVEAAEEINGSESDKIIEAVVDGKNFEVTSHCVDYETKSEFVYGLKLDMSIFPYMIHESWLKGIA